VYKKKAFNDRKTDFPYSTAEFERVRPYQRREIEPILARLFGKNMAQHPSLSNPKLYNRYVNEAITMYIIVRNVSALEYYLRQTACKIVDSNNNGKGVDFTKFFTYDFETEFAKANQNRRKKGRKKLNKGQAFANQFDLMNAGEIKWLFSNLLDLKFFDAIQKINKRAGKNPWNSCRPRGLVKNWNNFIRMFKLRNEIVHSMKRVRLSEDDLCSLCNNTTIFMEQANVLVYGAVQGGNAEQDFFHNEITDQERFRREELERSGKPSKQKKAA
jgi:hypothetical protein